MSEESAEHCCHPHKKNRFDPIMHGSLAVIAPVILLSFLNAPLPYIGPLADSLIQLFSTMWWGLALGLLTVGLMDKVPREYFTAVMGRGETARDILKATIAGVALDICNHGILMISAKLYDRGLSLAQIMAFLIASPWNSLTLTFVLISLIGLKWTLLFTVASMVIAFVSGLVYLRLVKNGVLPENPHTAAHDEDFKIWPDMKQRLASFRLSRAWVKDVVKAGWADGRMIVRWIVFGTLIAALMKTFIPADLFAYWLGPSLIGLFVTLVVATIIEVCSEGSAPIAAQIMNSAGAPGNGFAFLMAGVSTDYTEILVVKEFSQSWKVALSLPLVTVPQIIFLALLMNA